MKYYETRYNKSISNLKQAKCAQQLLGYIQFILELCNMTGLSKLERANFNIMKSMGEHTRQNLVRRNKTHFKLAEQLNSTKEIPEDMAGWSAKLTKDLMQFHYSGEQVQGTYKLDYGDWGTAFRKWKRWLAPSCSKWTVVFNHKDKAVTKKFVNSLKNIVSSLGITMGFPKFFMFTDKRPATYLQKHNKISRMKLAIFMVVIPNDKSGSTDLSSSSDVLGSRSQQSGNRQKSGIADLSWAENRPKGTDKLTGRSTSSLGILRKSRPK
jgi:hypothetical protein